MGGARPRSGCAAGARSGRSRCDRRAAGHHARPRGARTGAARAVALVTRADDVARPARPGDARRRAHRRFAAHVAAPFGRERALASLHSVGTCTGSLLSDADALIETTMPDVVLHAVTVEPLGGLNDRS